MWSMSISETKTSSDSVEISASSLSLYRATVYKKIFSVASSIAAAQAHFYTMFEDVLGWGIKITIIYIREW